MRKVLFFVFIIPLFFSLASCKEKKEPKKRNWTKIDKELIGVNKYLVKEDKDRIEKYIERNDLKTTESKTGLWYSIEKHGQGDSARQGEIVTLKYRVELLDGTYCYSSDSSGNLVFKLGKGDVPTGLQEGILRMRQGDKAVFIIPPHLAYGLVGDQNKIPSRAILVYHVELLKIQ